MGGFFGPQHGENAIKPVIFIENPLHFFYEQLQI